MRETSHSAGSLPPVTRSWINIYDDDELDYWAHRWSVSKDAVTKGVQAVGPQPAAVKKWLLDNEGASP